jgi:GTP diphosphokinase / guanosine-3',5'-bis(diphosphate) 3'-diphosphatase
MTSPHPQDPFNDLEYQREQFEASLITFSDDDQVRIHEALIFAEDAHGLQQREGGTPYIIHPIRAARIMVEDIACRDADMVMATLLHDVVEDTKETLEKIHERFGPRVAEFVHALTQDKGNETKQAYVERIIAGPQEVRLMKAADKLDNVRSVLFLDPENRLRKHYLPMIEQLYIPLADSTDSEYFMSEMRAAFVRLQE